jgi:dihydrofolate reductase
MESATDIDHFARCERQVPFREHGDGPADVFGRAPPPQRHAVPRNVLVMGGASIVRQFLEAGLLDELRIHLAHILLGDGTRFLDFPKAV